jgi:hypothetical protein
MLAGFPWKLSEWVWFITFIDAMIAVASMYTQLPGMWTFVQVIAGIILVYWLFRLFHASMTIRKRRISSP